MSQNTGCQGTITLPKTEFSKTCKAIIGTYNNALERDVDKFNRFIEKVINDNKGKRNLNWFNVCDNAYYKDFPQKDFNFVHHFEVLDIYSEFHKMTNVRNPETGVVESKKPTKLKFKKVKLSGAETQIDLPFASESSFTIDKSKVAIDLFVSFNNHNLERSQSNPFFKSTMKTLSDVKYNRNTGGTIYATEETDYHYCNQHERSYELYKLGNEVKSNIKLTKVPSPFR